MWRTGLDRFRNTRETTTESASVKLARFLLIAALSIETACASDTNASISSNAARPPASPSQVSAKQLELTRLEGVGLDSFPTPRSVVMVSDSAAWAAFGPGRPVYELSARSDYRAVGSSRDTGYTGLFSHEDQVYALRSSSVLRYEDRQSAFVPLLQLRSAVVAGAASDAAIWIVVRSGSTYDLHRFPRQRDGSVLSQSARVAKYFGPVSLLALADGTVLVGDTRSPYLVRRLNEQGDSTGVLQSTPFPQDSLAVVDARSVVSVGMVELEEGDCLQVFADLRSDTRWLVVHPSIGPARRKQLNVPIGFTHSRPRSARIVGVDDSPGRREIAFFRWSTLTSNRQEEK